MSEHPLGDVMSTAMAKIKEMVDADTVIGTPITTPDGIMLIPVSKLTFGFAGGGSDFKPKKQEANQPIMFGGGAGGGGSVVPVAFLVVENGHVRMLPVESNGTAVDKLIDLVPGAIDKVSGLVDKGKKKKEDEPCPPPDQE